MRANVEQLNNLQMPFAIERKIASAFFGSFFFSYLFDTLGIILGLNLLLHPIRFAFSFAFTAPISMVYINWQPLFGLIQHSYLR